MIRYLLAVLLGCFLFLCSGSGLRAQGDSFRLSPRLGQLLEQRSGDPVSVYMLLEEQVDMSALLDSFRLHRVDVKERGRIVNRQLRALAERSQTGWMAELSTLGARNIRSIWLANCLFFEADASAIRALSADGRIAYMDLDAPVALQPYQQQPGETRSLRGQTREPGLSVIRAPFMWEKGYTGYGRKALIIDTGVDPTHPALARNFAGNHVPVEQAWYPGTFVGEPQDCDIHGTHVAGTVLGIDRYEEDTIGVAFDAQWMGAAGLCGGGTFVLTSSLQWALDPDGDPETSDDMPDVINNSWHDPWVDDECGGIYVPVFEALEAAGIAVIFSAGNSGPSPNTITKPHNVNISPVNLFTVAAVNGNNAGLLAADFSSRGPSNCGGEGSLLIKPEVSAPGVFVRSCIPDGRYGQLSGTSMAAPHVAGAVLLLKEAFPYLSGEDIKYALYHSAADLGDAGEDNTYGMGIIQLDAAFSYLVDQGHDPVSPYADNDLALLRVQPVKQPCERSIVLSVTVENRGLLSQEGYTVQVHNEYWPVPRAFPVAEPIAAGERRTHELLLADMGDGRWDFSVYVVSDQDSKPLNDREVCSVELLEAVDWVLDTDSLDLSAPLCSHTSVRLPDSHPEGRLLWYGSPAGGAPVQQETSLFDVPELPGDLTLYAGLEVRKRFGAAAPGPDATYFASGEGNSMVFHVYHPVRIETVRCHAESRGLRVIRLVRDNGQIVKEITTSLQVGENTLRIDADLQPGRGYRLVLAFGRPLLGGDPMDPATAQAKGIFQLQGGEIDFAYVGSQLFFYDWRVRYEHPCERKPVVISLNDNEAGFQASFELAALPESSESPVSFVNHSVAAVSYTWDFGDGASSVEEHPVHIYTAPGIYEVLLKAVSADGCEDHFALSVDVPEGTTGLSPDAATQVIGLLVYPNPGHGNYQVWVESASAVHRLTVRDLRGAVLYIQENVPQGRSGLDLVRLPPGLYLLEVSDRSGHRSVERFVRL